MSHRKHKAGFTLIELLVVIGIIAILATILLPAYSKIKTLARVSSCTSNLHATGIGLRMYLNQNNGVMPLAAQMPSLTPDQPRIADVLADYINGPNVLKCPDDQLGNYFDYDRDTDSLTPVNRSKTYFESEGSSYEYHTLLGGRRVEEGWLTERLGLTNIPVMNDYRAFHGKPGEAKAMIYLYADGRVAD